MCFAKSAPAVVVEPQDPVIRHEADAALTKNSQNTNSAAGFKQNIKTSAIGIDDEAKTARKTLLGE